MKAPLDGVSLSVLVLLAAFAIDRLVCGTLFLLCYVGWLRDPETAANKARAGQNYKLAYFLFAAVLAVLVLTLFPDMRNLAALGRSGTVGGAGIFDTILTAIVYVGGADRISGLLKGGAGAPAAEEPATPIQVRGTLELTQTSGGERARSNTTTPARSSVSR